MGVGVFVRVHVCVCVFVSDRSLLGTASAHQGYKVKPGKMNHVFKNVLFATCTYTASCCGRHPGDMHGILHLHRYSKHKRSKTGSVEDW